LVLKMLEGGKPIMGLLKVKILYFMKGIIKVFIS
jgi:hypothetical protein